MSAYQTEPPSGVSVHQMAIDLSQALEQCSGNYWTISSVSDRGSVALFAVEGQNGEEFEVMVHG